MFKFPSTLPPAAKAAGAALAGALAGVVAAGVFITTLTFLLPLTTHPGQDAPQAGQDGHGEVKTRRVES